MVHGTARAGLRISFRAAAQAERRKALELWGAKIAALENGEAFNVVPFKRVVND